LECMVRGPPVALRHCRRPKLVKPASPASRRIEQDKGGDQEAAA